MLVVCRNFFFKKRDVDHFMGDNSVKECLVLAVREWIIIFFIIIVPCPDILVYFLGINFNPVIGEKSPAQRVRAA